MVFGGFVGFVNGMVCVAAGDLRLMRRVGVVLFLVVLGRLSVMVRRPVVMVGCSRVMVGTLVDGHDGSSF
jgi:hypothetical protein